MEKPTSRPVKTVTRTKRRINLDRILMELSIHIARSDAQTAEDLVCSVFSRLGRVLNVSRIRAFQLEPLNQSFRLSAEWNATGHGSEKMEQSFISGSQTAYWIQLIAKGRPLYLKDTTRLRKTTDLLSTYLARSGANAVLFVPVLADNRPLGFICFENTQKGKFWGAYISDRLSIFCQLIGSVWEIDACRRLNAQNESLAVNAESPMLALPRPDIMLMASISHDIRASLNAVTGLTEILLNETDRHNHSRYLDLIRAHSRIAANVVNNMLDLAKLNAGKLAPEKNRFFMRDLIDDLVNIFSYQATDKGLAIESSIDPDIPNLLIGDSIRLNQILINLVGNAIKFTDHGCIFINVAIEQQSKSQCDIAITVRDQGIGIRKEDLPYVFDPFWQSNILKRHSAKTGSGFGLSICKLLTEIMGGQISVTSEPDAGSTFTVRLPFELSMTAEESQSKEETLFERDPDDLESIGRWLQGARVLVADDVKINQEIIKVLLNRMGVNTEMADDGISAVDMARTGHYDAILMDILMPVLDGIEASQMIRNFTDPHVRDVPIIALTAHSLLKEEKELAAASIDDQIAKPIHAATLYRTLTHWIPDQAAPERAYNRPSRKNRKRKNQSGAAYSSNNLDQTKIGQVFTPSNLYDPNIGIQLLDGDLTIYRSVLNRFIMQFKSLPDSLRRVDESGWEMDIIRQLHNLKSIASMIGCPSLTQQAASIEKNLNLSNFVALSRNQNSSDFVWSSVVGTKKKQDSNNCKEENLQLMNRDGELTRQCNRLANDLDRVYSDIRQYLDTIQDHSGKDSSGIESSMVNLVNWLEKLYLFLSDYDPGNSKQLIMTLSKGRWSDEIDAKINAIQNRIEQYDFSGAQQMIQILTQFLKKSLPERSVDVRNTYMIDTMNDVNNLTEKQLSVQNMT